MRLVYAAGAVFALMIRTAGEVRSKLTFGQEVARVVGNIVEGLREVARTPKAGAAITTYFWFRLLWSYAIVSIGFVARDLLGDEEMTILIITGGAGAIGAVLGFVLAPRLVDKVRTTGTLVLGASVVAGTGILVFGAIEMNAALAVMTFLLGFGFFLAKITLDSMVQEALGDDFRGRAFSLYDIAYNLAWVLAAAALKLFYSEDIQGLLIAGMGAVFLRRSWRPRRLVSQRGSSGRARAQKPAVKRFSDKRTLTIGAHRARSRARRRFRHGRPSRARHARWSLLRTTGVRARPRVAASHAARLLRAPIRSDRAASSNPGVHGFRCRGMEPLRSVALPAGCPPRVLRTGHHRGGRYLGPAGDDGRHRAHDRGSDEGATGRE